jgi:RNA polymerase sigma factor (sigma-70 family)
MTKRPERNVTVNEHDVLAERFEANRPHLKSVAYRMLGSPSESDDAVQEAWLRLNGSDTSEVENLRGWLTTVVARECLDTLRSRKSRREDCSTCLRRDRSDRGTLPRSRPGTRKRDLVAAFLAASRAGNFGGLLAVLDPDVVARADDEAVRLGASRETRGAAAVAETFLGRAVAAQPTRERSAGACLGSRRPPARGIRLYGRAREDRRNRPSADPERLTELDLTILDG